MMRPVQQNKQSEEPRRSAYNKFLSIKSIIRNKKIIIKKQVPVAFGVGSSKAYSVSVLSNKPNFTEKQLETQRNYMMHKHESTTKNVINIQFTNEGEGHERSEQKIKRKLTNNFYLCGDEVRRPMLSVKDKREALGSVEQALIIEPLSKLETSFGLEKKKGLYSYMFISRKSRKGSREHKAPRDESFDLQPIGKQITQTQFYPRSKGSWKPSHISTSCLSKQLQLSESNTRQRPKYYRQSRTISHTAKLANTTQIERVEKLKQKQATEALIKQFKEILPLRKPSNNKNYFVFGMSDKNNEPENRIEMYRDFLWKVNYSNGLYVFTPDSLDSNYKAYIGPGNNSCMVKSILRRRNWWTIVDISQMDSCQFVWTQLKVNQFFKTQSNTQIGKHSNQFTDVCDQIRNDNSSEQNEAVSNLSHQKIFNIRDLNNWMVYYRKNAKAEEKLSEQTYVKRLKLYTKKDITKILESQKLRIHNHLQFNYYLGNKKALFYNIKSLFECKNENPFDCIPLTFHIQKGIQDPIYEKFLDHFKKFEELKKIDKNFRNLWICKPGENTNRGNGISVCSSLDDIKLRLRGKQKNSDGKPRTFILQKYIERPFLFKNRKFDIRHYILITCFNGSMKAYWFDQGYIRTSSSIFSLKNSSDLMIHLTNDAVQKKADTYGKHQKGNKVSYQDFQIYVDGLSKKKQKYDFLGKTLQKMKKIAQTAVEATYNLMDPNKKQHNFELIGLDFMIDQSFQPWLIEANTNPCLQLSSPLLQKLIPTVVEHTFRLCVDPFFPPPEGFQIKNRFYGENALLENRFQLIFDETVDGERIQKMYKERGMEPDEALGKIEEDNEEFQDDGNQNWQQKNTN